MKFWSVAHYSQTTTFSQPLDPVVYFTQRGQCHPISHRNKSQPWRRKVAFVVPSILRHTAFGEAVHNTALCSLQLAKGGPLLGFDGGEDGHKENMYVVTFYISRWILTGLVKRDTLIKYLLDELYTYEGDHCDALNPFDSLDSVARQGGEQGEVNPMCSLELRNRLDELRLQNEANQRRIEAKYQAYHVQQHIQHDNLVRHVNELLHSLQGDHSLSHPSHSHHFSLWPAQPPHRHHPYPRVLTGPGVVCFFLRITANPSADLA